MHHHAAETLAVGCPPPDPQALTGEVPMAVRVDREACIAKRQVG